MVVLVSVHLKKLHFPPNLTKQYQVQEVLSPFPLLLAVPKLGSAGPLVLGMKQDGNQLLWDDTERLGGRFTSFLSSPPVGKAPILSFFSVSTDQCQLQEDAHSFTLHLSCPRVLCSTGLSVLSMRQVRNWLLGEHTKRLEDLMPGTSSTLFFSHQRRSHRRFS